MKKLLIILFVGFLTSLIAQNQQSGFIGQWKWVDEDKTEIGTCTFDADGFVTLYVKKNNVSMGGKEFTYNGSIAKFKNTKAKMTYRIKNIIEIIEIDLTIKTMADEVIQKFLGIAKFDDPNHLKLGINFQKGNRPRHFIIKENLIRLERIKQ
jgi:hypothetical protein